MGHRKTGLYTPEPAFVLLLFLTMGKLGSGNLKRHGAQAAKQELGTDRHVFPSSPVWAHPALHTPSQPSLQGRMGPLQGRLGTAREPRAVTHTAASLVAALISISSLPTVVWLGLCGHFAKLWTA